MGGLALMFLILILGTEGNAKPDRIVEAEIAARGKFPFFAQLSITHPVNETPKTSTCGASLILPKWLLTAGHCVYGFEQNNTAEWYIIVLVIMSTNWRLDADGDYNTINRVVMHKDYKKSSRQIYNDIALLELVRPYETSKSIGYAYLPPVSRVGQNSTTRCESGTLVGVGLSKPILESDEDILRFVLYTQLKTKVQHEIQLLNTPGGYPTKFFTEVAWSKEGSLPADYGGPFVCYYDQLPLVYGLTSSGYTKANNTHVTFFEEVDKQMMFILATIPEAASRIYSGRDSASAQEDYSDPDRFRNNAVGMPLFNYCVCWCIAFNINKVWLN